MEPDPIGRPVREAPARGSLRRWILGIGVAGFILLGLIGFVLWWDAPPVVAPDLEPEPLPPLADGENGWALFEGMPAIQDQALSAALRMVRHPHETGGSWPDWDQALADDVIGRHASLLVTVEGALDRPGFRFPTARYDEPVESVHTIQGAANLLKLDAWSRFRSGDEDGAVRRATQIVQLGWRVCEGRGTMITWAVGDSCVMIGSMALRHLAAETDRRETLVQILAAQATLRRDPVAVAADLDRMAAVEFSVFKEGMAIGGREGMVTRVDTDFPGATHFPVMEFLAKPNSTTAVYADRLRATV